MQSSKASNQIQEEEVKALSVDKLQEQFSNLQQDWDIIKNWNPCTKKNPHFYSSSTSTITSTNSNSSSFSSSNLVAKTLDLLHQSSPRDLMLSLQNSNDLQHRHCSMMIARPIDSEVRDIIRDRRVAIQSGSLKGRRRLFNQSYDVLDEMRSALLFDDSSGENESFCGTEDIDFVQRHSSSLSGQRSKVLNEEKISCKNGVLNIHSLLLCVAAFVIYVIIRNFSEFDFCERDVILVPT